MTSMMRPAFRMAGLCALVVFIGASGVYFGPQVRSYLELTQMKPAWPRGLDSPLQPVEVSTASAAGTTLSYFGYRFEVPWKEITAVRNPAEWVEAEFEGGQAVKFANPDSFPNPRWDEKISNYEGYRSALAMTPSQLSPFSLHRKFAHSVYLLDFKGAWFEHNSAVPDIYSFQAPNYRGLEVSGLSRGWQWAHLYLFDAHDRRFDFIISVRRESETKLTQPEINTIIQSSAPAPLSQAAMLFQQLQSERTTARATDELLKLGKSDGTVRDYLFTHLPSMIEAGPNSLSVWSNAVNLAGGLKIMEAAPALAKFIGVTTGTGTLTLSGESHLRTSPTGLALVQIGDPAVPALQAVLEQGNSNDRWRAAFALDLIGSAKAKTVLSEHAPHEPDETLRDFIARATAK